ncbi:hypothetical protein PS3A_07870 [Pseudomonas sp. 3A(2025)]
MAAITIGLAMLWHMPNGRILTSGMWSMILAAGMLETIIRLMGNTISIEGATPKLHCSVAPEQTCGQPMADLP